MGGGGGGCHYRSIPGYVRSSPRKTIHRRKNAQITKLTSPLLKKGRCNKNMGPRPDAYGLTMKILQQRCVSGVSRGIA